MKSFIKQFRFALIIVGAAWALAAKAAQIYEIPPAKTMNDRFGLMSRRDAGACVTAFSPVQDFEPVTVERIIGFADHQFERRGFSDDFMSERLELAHEFPNSDYFFTRQDGEIVGAIAATYAEYGGAHVVPQRLPLQKSLRYENLRRPNDSRGRGLITELRTYAINGAYPRDIRSTLAFGGLNSVVEKYLSYPELMDEYVIYTYGDEKSIRLYQPMGFVNLTEVWGEKPIFHTDRDWWILGTTPRKLKELIDKEEYRFGHFAKSGGEAAVLPNGRRIRFLTYFSQRIENGKKTLQIVRTLADEVEIDDGLWAAKKADLIFDTEGRLVSVSQISRPYRVVGSGAVASAGRPIEFYPQTGKPRIIEDIAEPFEILPEVWVRAGERVEWLPDGQYMRIGHDFYNPILKVAASTGKAKRSRKSPRIVQSYIGVREIEDDEP